MVTISIFVVINILLMLHLNFEELFPCSKASNSFKLSPSIDIALHLSEQFVYA